MQPLSSASCKWQWGPSNKLPFDPAQWPTHPKTAGRRRITRTAGNDRASQGPTCSGTTLSLTAGTSHVQTTRNSQENRSGAKRKGPLERGLSLVERPYCLVARISMPAQMNTFLLLLFFCAPCSLVYFLLLSHSPFFPYLMSLLLPFSFP